MAVVTGDILNYEETAALLRELDALIDGDHYFMSPRIKTLKAIRAKLRPEPVREPLAAECLSAAASDGSQRAPRRSLTQGHISAI